MAFPLRTALAGVIGDGRPLTELVASFLAGIFSGPSISSGGSLLGAGVKLLLGPRVAVLPDKGSLAPSTGGRLDTVAVVVDVFF